MYEHKNFFNQKRQIFKVQKNSTISRTFNVHIPFGAAFFTVLLIGVTCLSPCTKAVASSPVLNQSQALESDLSDIANPDKKSQEKKSSKPINKIKMQNHLLKRALHKKDDDTINAIKNSKGYLDLAKITNENLAITDKSFQTTKTNFRNNNFNTSSIKVDLLDENNLKAALIAGLKFAVSDTKQSNFIFDNNDPWSFEKDTEIKTKVLSLIDYLDNSKDSKKDQQINILKMLQELHALMKESKIVSEKESFPLFIDGMKKAYQVCISRRVADKVLEENRAKMESKLGTKKVSREAKVSGEANVHGASVGVGVVSNSGEGSSDSSFYTINIGGGLSASIGADLYSMLSAKANASVDKAYSEILFSLEQYLDKSLPSGTKLTSISITKTSVKRKQMQDLEKELLSVFKIEIEGYLNAIGFVPISVPLEWPCITKVPTRLTSDSTTASLGAAVNAFSALNLSVSGSANNTLYKSHKPYLELINDDCSVADGLDSKTVIEFLKATKGKNYLIIQSAVENEIKNDKTGTVLSSLTATVLGDIRDYNAALMVLSNKNATKQEKKAAKLRKHGIEERWTTASKFKRHSGRKSMLKSMITTAIVLRNEAKSERDIELFRELYEEINRLYKVQIFAKDKRSHDSSFITGRKTTTNAVTGKTSVEIPFLGEGSISITYKDSEGPVCYDNAEDLTVQIKLPTVFDGIAGGKIAKALFSSLAKISNSKLDLGDAFLLVESALEDCSNLFSKSYILNPNVGLVANGYFTYTLNFTKTGPHHGTDQVLALPGNDDVLTKGKHTWTLKNSQKLFSTELGANVKIPSILNVKILDSIGRQTTKISKDSIETVTSKYNCFKLGLGSKAREAKNKNTLWESFKSGQQHQLLKIFNNVAKPKSNIKYELQNLYNDINNTAVKSNATDLNEPILKNTFEKFIASCKILADEDKLESSSEFNEALSGLEQILETNYSEHFIKELNAAQTLVSG